jgi:hypothetical protein
MKFPDKGSPCFTSSGYHALPLGAVATVAFILLSSNASLAQGLLGADLPKPKREKAANSTLLSARSSAGRPDNLKLDGDGVNSCNQIEADRLPLDRQGERTWCNSINATGARSQCLPL